MWKKIVKFFKWAATYESDNNSNKKKEDDAAIIRRAQDKKEKVCCQINRTYSLHLLGCILK